MFLELSVRDDERGSRRQADVPLDVPIPPGGSPPDVPARDLVDAVRRVVRP